MTPQVNSSMTAHDATVSETRLSAAGERATGDARQRAIAALRTGGEMLSAVAFGQTERARTLRNALTAFAVRCASAAILYATQVLLARLLGSYEYGIYVFVWTWVLILGGLGTAGLGTNIMRLSPAYRAAGDYAHFRGVVRGSRALSLGVGTLLMLIGLAGLAIFSDLLDSHYVLPLYLGLFCIPLIALTDLNDGLGRGQAFINAALIPPYILRPILLIGVMLAAFEAGFVRDATTAVGAAIVATWLAVVIQTLWINRNIRATIPAGSRTYDIGGWLKSSLPILIIIAGELALQNADVLVISQAMTPTDVAIYFAAGKTMALILFVHYAVGSAVANKFSELHATGNKAALEVYVRDAAHWTFWPSLASALLLIALGKPLLSLFGEAFVGGYAVMCILVVGFLCRAAAGPSDYLLNMLGEQVICAKILLLAAVASIVLNIVLVPIYGLVGAAIATSTALALAAGLQALAIRHRTGINVAIWSNLKRHTA